MRSQSQYNAYTHKVHSLRKSPLPDHDRYCVETSVRTHHYPVFGFLNLGGSLR